MTLYSGPEGEERSDTCGEASGNCQCSEESNLGDRGHGLSFLLGQLFCG